MKITINYTRRDHLTLEIPDGLTHRAAIEDAVENALLTCPEAVGTWAIAGEPPAAWRVENPPWTEPPDDAWMDLGHLGHWVTDGHFAIRRDADARPLTLRGYGGWEKGVGAALRDLLMSDAVKPADPSRFDSRFAPILRRYPYGVAVKSRARICHDEDGRAVAVVMPMRNGGAVGVDGFP